MEFRETTARDTWITVAWIGAVGGVVVAAGLLANRVGVGLFIATAVIAVLVLIRWMARAWGYRCPACKEVFQVSMLGQFTAVNMGAERNVRCPRCGKRSWVKALRKVG
jgi:DNA-directed RNA polymerase subunit RPC12/RpoP